MEFTNITSRLGDNLSMWQKLLLDIKYVSWADSQHGVLGSQTLSCVGDTISFIFTVHNLVKGMRCLGVVAMEMLVYRFEKGKVQNVNASFLRCQKIPQDHRYNGDPASFWSH